MITATPSSFRRRITAAVAVAGAALAATGIANTAFGSDSVDSSSSPVAFAGLQAATTTSTTSTITSVAAESPDSDTDHGRPYWRRRMDRPPLTDELAAQVTAAAEDAVPGATVVWTKRADEDDEIAYLAHVTDADGNDLRMIFDDDLGVVDVQVDMQEDHDGWGDQEGDSGRRDRAGESCSHENTLG